ncbi:PRC-barrel domain-containing protein [Glaciimonas sp. PAMC28666]|uniref:PRC-barrel domain-containing protein n=1 Tax=Glaciimonas sp. PAMC28666 TaxID=2807626 RepID=UPI001965B3C5|nr:PRC-barrel domain-containing protein [Glaciimonas sp. PAMC28666]QRX82428.1 PRC-barrel domain-containing protein [Glaciimonas sp. PAMC28666]
MSYLDRDTYGIYKNNVNGGPGPDVLGADTLIGNDVCNQSGEDLGDIKELMIDTRTGKVNYAVLSFGGFLGMGEKLFAVPWSVLKLDSVNERFILDVDKDRLKSAPGFDKDHWPDMADQSWSSEIDTYYGSDGYVDTTPRL